MKFFYVLAILAVAGVYQVRAQDKCHTRYLQECFAAVLAVTSSSDPAGSIPTNEAEVDRMCEAVKETHECSRNYTNKCLTPTFKNILPTFQPQFQKHFDRFCQPDGDVRQNYLKHATCLKEAAGTEEARACVNDARAALDLVDENLEEPFELGCCAYARFRKCSEGVVEAKCGAEAIEYGNVLTRNGFGSLFNRVCSCVDSASEQCTKLLPAPGTAPQGKNSNSPVARLLATFIRY